MLELIAKEWNPSLNRFGDGSNPADRRSTWLQPRKHQRSARPRKQLLKKQLQSVARKPLLRKQLQSVVRKPLRKQLQSAKKPLRKPLRKQLQSVKRQLKKLPRRPQVQQSLVVAVKKQRRQHQQQHKDLLKKSPSLRRWGFFYCFYLLTTKVDSLKWQAK